MALYFSYLFIKVHSVKLLVFFSDANCMFMVFVSIVWLFSAATVELTKWLVTASTEGSNESKEQEFDYVFICTGHFKFPRYIEIPGLEKFKGQVIHSKFYDDPKDFEAKTVLIIGNGMSGIDICTELIPKASHVYVSGATIKDCFGKEKNVSEIALVQQYEAHTHSFVLEGGQVLDAKIDSVIFCTGYTYDLPFVDKESCELKIEDGFISPMFKFAVHAKYPSLFLIGLNQRVVPFPFFYYQSSFCWSFIENDYANLPSNVEELAKTEERDRLKTKKKRHFFWLGAEEGANFSRYYAEVSCKIDGFRSISEAIAKVAELRFKYPCEYKKWTVQLEEDGSVLISETKPGS